MILGTGETALHYLERTMAAYRAMPLPQAELHDWTWRAERTLSDLMHAPSATVLQYGDRYVMPYPNGQYPDAMVQLALIATLRTYAAARGTPLPFEADLRKGLHRFYDPSVGTLRRYLPSVGLEKDFDAVDSWYLYHPMTNLARLAIDEVTEARALLLQSVGYGIRAAHHFAYAWPVMYDITDFRVMTQQLDAGRPGETDAGGLYAYLMMQLHELTGDGQYLHEGRAALEAADGAGLSLMYQLNLTAWGAAACLRLWKETGERCWIERGYYWLANLLHHCPFVERRARAAEHYPTFMAATCMYNSDYVAAFEDYECFLALQECLRLGGNELDPAARTFAREFCRYAMHRGWFYYPEMLPADILSGQQESGVIDRTLSFPLEDLYPDGRPAGQVGQEIYGAGAAFVYAAHVIRQGTARSTQP